MNSDEENYVEDIDDCTFVKLVECRPWLYDAEHPKYKNIVFKEETWRLIANAMGWEDDESVTTGTGVQKCKSTWKRLRDNFMRALRKLPSGAGAHDGETLRKRPIYEALMFLRKVKDKNTRMSSGNFKSSAPLLKKRKVSSPSVPGEQWNDPIIIMEKNSMTEQEENEENSTEISQSPRPQSPEQSSSSGAAGIIHVDSSPLGAAIKRPPPQRVNPPIDTYAKKKSSKFNKFEDMLTKGFENLNSLMVPPAAAPEKKSANATFCEYLLMELEEIPKQKQAAVRQQLIIHLNSLKDVYGEVEDDFSLE